jgi:hypothetical protein
VLDRPPRPSPPDRTRDILNTLLSAGIPIALWTRRPAEAPANCGLKGLVHGESLSGLPDWVWNLRRQAVSSADVCHAGRHVTLLWDDPTRLSPDYDPEQQLRPPT